MGEQGWILKRRVCWCTTRLDLRRMDSRSWRRQPWPNFTHLRWRRVCHRSASTGLAAWVSLVNSWLRSIIVIQRSAPSMRAPATFSLRPLPNTSEKLTNHELVPVFFPADHGLCSTGLIATGNRGNFHCAAVSQQPEALRKWNLTLLTTAEGPGYHPMKHFFVA